MTAALAGAAVLPVPLAPLGAAPLVSVLVANYNYARYIGGTIESVRGQTYDAWEVVVCDDGSTDDSTAIISAHAASEPRVRLVRQGNGGVASALNRGFAATRGQVVCVLDADDTFAPEKLARVVQAFRQDGVGLVTHDLRVVDSEGHPVRPLRYSWEGYIGPDIPTLRMGLPVPQASGLSFRREILEAVLPLPADQFRSAADWAIAYVAAYLTRTARVPELLADYRIHGANLSGTTSTLPALDERAVAKTLAGIDRVIDFADAFLSERYKVRVPRAHVRNRVEHRLMLGLLRRDRALTAAALGELRGAYRDARRDYPAARYAFWQTLSALPASLAEPALHLAFQGFKAARALRTPAARR